MSTTDINYDAIPEELKQRDQWLHWSTDTDTPKRPHRNGDFTVAWSDPAEWLSFEAACEAAEANPKWGIGYVTAAGNDDFARGIYGVVDIDGAAEPDGAPKEWVPSLAPFFEREAYIEWSQSGEGIHIPIAGVERPDWWRDVHRADAEHEGIDLLDNKFCIFTGDAERGRQDPDGVIDAGDWFYEWLLEAYEAVTGRPPETTDTGSASDTPTDSGETDVEVGVYDVLSRAQYPEGERLEHPYHGSGTGSNFFVDDDGETFRCWRHDCTGNAGHLLGMDVGVISCGEWVNGGLDTDTWRDIFDAARAQGYDIPAPSTSGGSEPPEPPEPDDSSADIDPDEAFRRRVEDATAYYSDQENVLKRTANQMIADAAVDIYDFVYPKEDVPGWRHTLYAYHHSEGVYHPDGEEELAARLDEAAGSYATNTVISEVVEKVKRRVQASPGDLESAPERLVVENGILDLTTGELDDYDPSEHHQTRIPVRWVPEGRDTEALDTFLHDVVADEDVDTLYRLVAHMLYKDYPDEKAAMLLGSGENGKSVFITAVQRFLGRENVSHRELHDFSEQRFAANQLQGKLANLAADMGDERLEDMSMFRKLTGGDTLHADVKFESPLQFQNHASMVFAVNEMPEFDADFHAIWRRWLPIEFPYTFREGPKGDKDPVPKDELLAGITSHAEQEALLRRCQAEIEEWATTTRDFFPDAASPEKVREDMKAAAEPVYDFATTMLVEADDSFLPKNAVRTLYEDYAEEQGYGGLDPSVFGRRLMGLPDYRIETGRRRAGGNPMRVYEGVDWSEEAKQWKGIADEKEAVAGPDGQVSFRNVGASVRDKVRDAARRLDEQTSGQTVPRPAVAGAVAATTDYSVAQDAIDALVEDGGLIEDGDGLVVP